MNIILLICIIGLGYTLSVQITQKPTCFYVKSYDPNTQLIVTYMVSGMDESKTEVYIEKENGEKLIRKQNTKDGVIKENLQDKGTYFVCFKSLNKSYKTVSFDFDMEGVDKEYAQSEQFNVMSKELSRTHRNFQSIYRNQHWINDREDAHKIILEQVQESVKFSAFAKIGVLVLICLSQVFVVYNFFKGKDLSEQV